MLIFALDVNERVGERIARIAREAVSLGPMGCYLQRERYASFLDIWDMSDDYSRLIDAMHSGAVLGGVKTSCAVDASAVLGYAGKRLHKPWHADGTWGITSWLGMGFDDSSWCDSDPMYPPELGDYVYRGRMHDSNGHVEIVSERLPNGLYRCVAGGGGLTPDDTKGLSVSQIRATNGTVMRETPPEGKDIFAKDGLGRVPAGWWRASLMGLPTYEDILEQLRKTNG